MGKLDVKALVQNLITLAKDDALKVLLPALVTFFNTIAANPSKLALVAAVAKLQVDVLTALPGIEQDVLKDLAEQVNTLAQEVLSPGSTTSPAPATPVAESGPGPTFAGGHS